MYDKIRATYRVQLNPSFDFEAATGIVEYLSGLGISHLYCSPYLQAAPGSTHGYDVVNYHQVNKDLGGVDAHTRLNQELVNHHMGQVLDMVPNHMAVTGPENPWWWDLLQNGTSSRYASYFDLDWNPRETRHGNEVLAPVLGDHYGRVLESGEISLERRDGIFLIRYYEHIYPVDPRTMGLILRPAAERCESDTLEFLADAFSRLPAPFAYDRARAKRRYRDQTVLTDLFNRLTLEDPEVEAAVHAVVQEINEAPDALDQLLERQNYRLAYWRLSREELGYRRFFDINNLIGLRIEDEEVYQDTHALVLGWLKGGLLDGLRIDHPDGLRDPQGYFRRLKRASSDAWIVVEKILEVGEPLRESWPVAGTTGYDFLNRVNGLFVDADNEDEFTQFYADFTGERTDYDNLVREKKHLVMEQVLGSDLNRLAAMFLEVTERHRRYRGYTMDELRGVLTETAACFPVYRTYVRAEENQVSEEDIFFVNEAIEAAKINRPDLDPELFDFFRDLLLLRVSEVENELVMRFQQFTGPVMAKGVEDTTFYCYNRFVSLNEVGGTPKHFGVSVDDFHAANTEIQEHWPKTMLTTSTHDTKRSEDVRARLNVLSEIPEAWFEAVERWSGMTQAYKTKNNGVFWPDRNMEYLLYQTLVGAWPIELERVLGYAGKAAREAKQYSSWRDPNADYEQALAAFIRGMMEDEAFVEDLKRFAAPVIEIGRTNSLAQTLIKLTAPGVPDIYQGTELWNLSLVDPDNRRPVDFARRKRLLDELGELSGAGAGELSLDAVQEILSRMESGLPKLWLIRQSLDLRSRRPEWFGAQGDYQALEATGGRKAHVVAFARGGGAIAVAPRLLLRSKGDWADTQVVLPQGRWRNVLTGERVDGGEAEVSKLLANFPVCLLAKEE